MRQLLQLKADTQYETRNHKTALTWASTSGQMEAMEILLQVYLHDLSSPPRTILAGPQLSLVSPLLPLRTCLCMRSSHSIPARPKKTWERTSQIQTTRLMADGHNAHKTAKIPWNLVCHGNTCCTEGVLAMCFTYWCEWLV